VSQAKPAVNAMRMQAWLPQAGTRCGRRRRCGEASWAASSVLSCNGAVYLEYVVRRATRDGLWSDNAAKEHPQSHPRGLPNMG
jgi:hypothetical protein